MSYLGPCFFDECNEQLTGEVDFTQPQHPKGGWLAAWSDETRAHLATHGVVDCIDDAAVEVIR